MCTPPVGRGATAERWYRETDPIVAALAAYEKQRGAYPDSLRDLVPNFLDAAALSTVRMAENGSLSYQRDSTGYTLRFEYHGPGMNHCSYQPRAAEWKCSGYF